VDRLKASQFAEIFLFEKGNRAMTIKQNRMIVIALIIVLLSGMFVPMNVSTASASTTEEMITEDNPGEINLTGEKIDNMQVLFAAEPMSVDTSVQLETLYRIDYDNWFTHRFRIKVNGEWQVAYCMEPDKWYPDNGSYEPDANGAVEYDVAKAIYYSYGYPGFQKTTKPVLKELFAKYGSSGFNLNKADDCYSICHILLSYYYDDDSANNADAFTGVDATTRNIIRALAKQMKEDRDTFPDVPRGEDVCKVAMSSGDVTKDGLEVEVERKHWDSDKAIQKTPTIKVSGYRDNSVTFTVPAGATMYLTEDGTTQKISAGTKVTVYVGDSFYFTADENKTGTWNSGTLKAGIASFTPYMLKVTGKQTMAFAGVDNADTTSFSIDWLDEGVGELYKKTTNTELTKNNENYSLAGGVFEVRDSSGKLYATMTTNTNGYAKLTGIPYGTYKVSEKTPPKGHAATDEVVTVVINSPRAKAVHFDNLAQSNPIHIAAYKADAEKSSSAQEVAVDTASLPQKGATLEGAVFEVNFYGVSTSINKYDVTDHEPLRTWRVETDENGEAILAAEYLDEDFENDPFYKTSKGEVTLPIGIVTVSEIEPPRGYLPNEQLHIQKITPEGTAESFYVFYTPTTYDDIIRGDFEFIKVSDGSMKRMANVAFRITSLYEDGKKVEDGESHIIVTDENGYFNSDADWNKHTNKTNANDAAWNGNSIDDSKLDSRAGVWFGEPNALGNDDGAMPYGTYRLDELRCDANKGHQLLKGIEFNISRDGVTIDMGTMTDDHIEMSTKASDPVMNGKLSYARENFTLKDTVKIKGVDKGTKYTVKGILMDKETQMPLLIDGKEVTAEKTFTAGNKNETVEMDFNFNAKELQGKEVVVFEALYEGKYKVAMHEDIDDEGQTIRFADPEIKTTALGKLTNFHEIFAEDKVTVVDEVKLTGLVPGEEVTVKGSIVDKETGEALTKFLGIPLTVSKTFVPANETETVTMEFTFDASKMEGKSLVVYERLEWNGEEIEKHTDLNDAEQTVHFPKIGTSAKDSDTGIKNSLADEEVTIVDTVSFENLIAGNSYKVSGKLMDKETGEPLLIDGKEVTAEKEFTAESVDGTVELTFTFDGSKLEGETVVVFEEMYRNDKLIAVHADIEDEGQTVYFPEIKTTAKDSETGMQNSNPDKEVTIVDTVSFENLIAGNTYKVSGKLMDKETGEPLLIDGKEVTAEKEFVAESEAGSVDLTFTFDGSALKGKTVVVFEDVYYADKLVAVHADIDDKDQSIYFPEVKTTATDKADGDKKVIADGKVTIKDTVSYENLVAGEKYTVYGKLMDKETGKPFMLDDKEVTAEKTFVCEKANGTIELEFTFDASGLEDMNLVVFEKLYHAASGIEVAAHEDIEDEGQTVEIEKPAPPVVHETPKTGDDTNVLLWAGLMVGALAAIIALRVRARLKEVHKEDDFTDGIE